MSRPAKRFATRPVDPRARDVIAYYPQQDGTHLLALDCNHVISRRYTNRLPERAICTTCHAAGGIGGNQFEAT